jgi:RNA polymerase sigma-70 factor (ECF subfamily)
MFQQLSVAELERTFTHRELIELMPALRARALKLCLNKAEAEDLVQDTLERALRFGNSYQAGTNLRAWAQQILFTIFVTRCRRRRRERRALTSLTIDPCAWTFKEGGPPMGNLSSKLERMVSDLPPQFAIVIRLVDLHELSYKEAANELGVPIGTVMSRLSRGRKLLAVALSIGETVEARAA